MSWRCILVSSKSRLYSRNNSLVIERDEAISVPMEDIGALVVENREISISTAALSDLVDKGSVVYVCDDTYTPSGVLLPLSQHSRQLTVVESQIAMSEPLKKRIWQQLVQSKIENQAQVLDRLNETEAAVSLRVMKKSTNSGDTLGREAQAAREYWKHIQPSGHTRSTDGKLNSALNYGYAIIRGALARHIAGYGLLPVLGVHHRSSLNQFNLADDMIEPFRPVVDACVVFGNIWDNDNPSATLTKHERSRLVDVLNHRVYVNGGEHTVLYACEIMVQGFRSCIEQSSADYLKSPTLVTTQYEQ